jgi:hypothetical protein
VYTPCSSDTEPVPMDITRNRAQCMGFTVGKRSSFSFVTSVLVTCVMATIVGLLAATTPSMRLYSRSVPRASIPGLEVVRGQVGRRGEHVDAHVRE